MFRYLKAMWQTLLSRRGKLPILWGGLALSRLRSTQAEEEKAVE